MSPELNQQALELAYHSGWITAEQYTSAATALQAMPHLSAIDLLHEQSIISAGQAEGLRQALQNPPPAVETAAVQSDTGLEQPHAAPAEPAAHAPTEQARTPEVSVVSEFAHVDRSRRREVRDR